MFPQRLRSGGLAAWSIRHPVGTVMIALALVALGLFSLGRLGVDLLPNIIYPEIAVRVTDPGVPATVMEDRVTRHLEEQLAVTEDAIGVQSQTSEGRVSLDLSFPYGKDIDIALRDTSTRLDRARRLLPTGIEPPSIFKRDPSQIPIAEFAVSSPLRDPVELRTWVDDTLAKWFLNLPGVAAAEVGGGLVREIQVQPDIHRLQALGLGLDDVIDALQQGNLETPTGRLETPGSRTGTRLTGRVLQVADLARLPVPLPGQDGQSVPLGDLARIIDTHADEQLRIRFNGRPGIKLSIQKQPQANTVAVMDAVKERLAWLEEQGILPPDIHMDMVDDQSVYVRHALDNAVSAAASGAALAMLVVYLFLGDLRRTLIIGTAIPIALVVTFMLMDWGGLTLNIMTLGGLALGVGMLLDSAIVMLENITRHQHHAESPGEAGIAAATEVNSAIIASTSTNLAAVLPFLFIGGLIGLLFRELIFTIAAAMLAAMLVALTLVPALAARVPPPARPRPHRFLGLLQGAYGAMLGRLLRWPWLPVLLFGGGLVASVQVLLHAKQIFLPEFDEGRISISVTAEPGIPLEHMDGMVRRMEEVLTRQPETVGVYVQVGGFVFGRSQFEASHRSSLSVQLVPSSRRNIGSAAWIRRVQPELEALKLVGVEIRARTRGVRGIRLSQGDDDLSLRIQGKDLDTLAGLGAQAVERLKDMPELRNLSHSYEEITQELAVNVDRARAADLGLTPENVGTTLGALLGGKLAGSYVEGDRQFDVRVRLPRGAPDSPEALADLLIHGAQRQAVRLGEVAHLQRVAVPAQIQRDNQQRVVEISASLAEGAALGLVSDAARARLQDLPMPAGYVLYDGGASKTLREGRRTSEILLGLAVFLVFVVMAVQYESLRNPLVILLGVPFSVCGVALALHLHALPLSMPVWLGMIMLAGIVVNNTIVLVEAIELQREAGHPPTDAIVSAARLRLRPIFMTTLTTVVGLLPLALGWGEGSEMLRPLAVVILYGLGFSVLVSLVLVPMLYRLLAK